jgi:hypothetical protein
MGFYLLPKRTHKKIDTINQGSFGGVQGINLSTTWLSGWLFAAKNSMGGLGIINTQVLNECLMVKWIWKIYTHKESLWVRLLHAKYMRNGDFFRSRVCRGLNLEEFAQDQALV